MGRGVSSVVRSTAAVGTVTLGLAGILMAASPLLCCRSAFDNLYFLISGGLVAAPPNDSQKEMSPDLMSGWNVYCEGGPSFPDDIEMSAHMRSNMWLTELTCTGGDKRPTVGGTFLALSLKYQCWIRSAF